MTVDNRESVLKGNDDCKSPRSVQAQGTNESKLDKSRVQYGGVDVKTAPAAVKSEEIAKTNIPKS